MIKRVGFLLFFLFTSVCVQAQVKWLTFEELDSALTKSPKPVLIEFYTDWCTYCKKMDKEVFTDQSIIETLNSSYYAVRFDAETEKVVSFDGYDFVHQEGANFHQLPMSLAAKDGQFAPPALIFLDKQFNVIERVFSYQSRKKLLAKLKKHL